MGWWDDIKNKPQRLISDIYTLGRTKDLRKAEREEDRAIAARDAEIAGVEAERQRMKRSDRINAEKVAARSEKLRKRRSQKRNRRSMEAAALAANGGFSGRPAGTGGTLGMSEKLG